MSQRAKRPLDRVRSFAEFLEPWPSFSDRTLRTVLRRGVHGPTRFDDLMATAMMVLLGMVGLVIGWALFVS